MAVFLKILLTLEIGLATGMLSGAFGIGGGFISTPAIRLILEQPAAIALGTPLPVIFPTALVGGINYLRAGLVNKRAVLFAASSAVPGSMIGALSTNYISANWLMVATGVVIVFLASRSTYDVLVGRRRRDRTEPIPDPRHVGLKLVAIGFLAGLFSGLLGVGGGVILIPSFLYLLRMDIKEAFGTSLFCITIMAIPGTIVHYFLGHINVSLFLLLSVGVMPGAYLGSRFTIQAHKRLIMLLFSLLLLAIGIIFIFTELRILL